MAPKRPSAPNDPPAASSSSEEEETASGEVEDASEEEEGEEEEVEQKLKKDDNTHADGSLTAYEGLNELVDFNKNWGVGELRESVVKRGLELIEASKKAELEEQWRKLHFAELELFVRRAELVRDQARLILEAFESSNN